VLCTITSNPQHVFAFGVALQGHQPEVDLEQGRVPPRCLDHDCVAQGAGRDAVVESAAGPPSQVGNATGARAWRDYRVQPWRVETFTFATDPELVGKVTDVVGLYMVPPQNAIVLCVDAKSQVQALDRTAPMLPMQPGRPDAPTPTAPRHDHLFAALEVGRHRQGHRHLPTPAPASRVPALPQQVARAYPERELHLVMHNYAAHKRVEIRDWLAHNPAHAGAPHADLSVLDEPGRGLVRHHRTSGNPPRHLGQRPRPDHQDPRLHRRLERPLPPIRLDQDRKQILTRANRQKTSNTTILSAWVSAAWVTGELLAVPAASARRRRSGGRG
jgi:hypothetical protein